MPSVKRQARRELFTVTVDYIVAKESGEPMKCDKGSAVTSNISRKGLGMYIDRALQTGQEIKVYSKHLGDKPMDATVRWSNKVADSTFRSGIQFN